MNAKYSLLILKQLVQMVTLLFWQAVLSLLARDWCRIELGVKVAAISIWYYLGVCLYEQRKTTNNLGQGRLCS